MATVLQHQGYYGSVEASTEDNCLYGKVLYIQALINYEAKTVTALEKAFRHAVEDYLRDCEQGGVPPEKPCKGSFNVRVGHDLHLAAARVATSEGASLNDLVRKALTRYLAQRTARHPR
ncbi:type II toxin-antitoxin system HicB family antitoxin [Alloalcanivorax sp. C16-1]|uniref:type II toxin-antitoxin system HicB family antitoxin n=1 Tax=Alloalcanivorax sp. C16-1 TaxID=3390051 RepID=UPI0039705270